MVGLQCLREADEESPEGKCISGGGFIRLANRELARAYLRYSNGITCRNRAIAVNFTQEYKLQESNRNPNKLGAQRFFTQVWETPQSAK